MEKDFLENFDVLLTNYTELLLGEQNETLKKKVELWMLYSHMAKSMPGLVKHWNAEFPNGKKEMVKIVTEIKKLNELQKQNKK
ncbi:DUF2573 family protein [Niallia sp. 03133]|uniref:DUF2573 family protein n=1 Tax=Niallia sp. 03133 TaxID=3458060 RepID=UPI004044A39E